MSLRFLDPSSPATERVHQPVSSIKIYYRTALLLLLLVVIVSFTRLRQFVLDQTLTSTRFKFKHLASHPVAAMAFVALQWVTAPQDATAPDLRREFGDLTEQVAAAQAALTDSLSASPHDELTQASSSLSALLDNYLVQARRLMAVPAAQLGPQQADVVALLKNEADIQQSLAIMIQEYERIHENRGTQFVQSEMVFFSILLLSLTVLTMYIFYRMERRIQADQGRLLQEIDMRREVETTLLRSEALYQLLAQNLPNTAVILFDQNLRCLLVEGAIIEEAGYRKQDMEGKTIYDVLPPATLQRFLPVYQAALKGLAWDFEHTSSTGKSYRIHSLPVKDDRGAVIGGMITLQDLTQHKEAEKKLHENQLFIERVLRSTPDMIYIFDMDQRRTIFSSQILSDLLGYTPEEFYAIGGPQFLFNMVHPDDQARFEQYKQAIMNQLESSDPLDFELRLRHATDGWRWFSTRSLVFNSVAPMGMFHKLSARCRILTPANAWRMPCASANASSSKSRRRLRT
ncbi:PAS domain-containing protein [bacterium]|nr:PAS domain-containing protein [bacterium]